jgi:nucleotide-binding universal stress UspA family protein
VSFTSVVVGVDGSAESDDALRWALAEAQLRHLPLRPVWAWYPSGSPEETEKLASLSSVAELRLRLGDDLRSYVDRATQGADTSGVAIDSRVVYGHPTEQLVREAGDDRLLVVGSRGRGGIKASMLGSVSHSCAQYARGAVAVVRGDRRRHTGTGRVVVGVDGSAASVAALRLARDAAALRGARTVVIHAWTLPYLALTAPAWAVWPEDVGEAEAQARVRLDESLRLGAADRTRVDTEAILVNTFPGRALLDAAQEADLLVVGTRGNGGWKGLLLGSVSMQCLTHSPCPVVVVREQAHSDGVPDPSYARGDQA